MESTIPSRSIKLFVKIIQCLSRIGDYANIEALNDKLILVTVSESRSAFVSYTLDKTFFKEYKLTNNELGSLRVPLKPCLAVFKNINSIETCSMLIDLVESKLIFNISCKLGIKRVYKLYLEDSTNLRAFYNRSFPNKIAFKPGPMLESLQNNFRSTLDEITMKISKEKVQISSYIDETRSNANKLLRTEITLSKQEFLEFNAKNTVELTFCLKEMKAILSFCETSGQPVTLFYEKPGKPMLLVLHFFNVIEADFVLATLLEQGTNTGDSSQSSLENSSGSISDINTSSPSSSYPSSISSMPSSIQSSSMPSSSIASPITSSTLFSKEDPYAIPSSLTDIKYNPKTSNTTTENEIVDFASGHVSGSDDESEPVHKINLSEKRRKRPVFSADFENLNSDNDEDEEMEG